MADHNHEQCCGHGHHIHSADGQEPAVCSLHMEISPVIHSEDSDIQNALAERLLALRDWALQKEYLIGHIKAYFHESENNIWLSCTGGNIDVRKEQDIALGCSSESNDKTAMGITAIIFGPDEAELLDAMNRLVGTLPLQNAFISL